MALQLSVFLVAFLYFKLSQTSTPSIDRCPGTIFRRVASSDSTVSVTWDDPDCGPNAQSTHEKGSKFGPGVYNVIYWFSGGSQTNANQRCCSFDVFVAGPDFDLCSQNVCDDTDVCVPEVDHYYCYPGSPQPIEGEVAGSPSSQKFVRFAQQSQNLFMWPRPYFDRLDRNSETPLIVTPSRVQPDIRSGATNEIVYPKGFYPVTYSFADVYGNNLGTNEFVVVYFDDLIPPMITSCPSDITVEAPNGTLITVHFLDTSNATDGSGTVYKIFSSASPVTLTAGDSSTLSYAFLDGSNNVAVCSSTITVLIQDNIPPVVHDCSQEITFSAQTGTNYLPVNWTVPSSVDSLEGGDLVASSHAPGDLFPVGETTTVLYVFEDAAGLQTSCFVNITLKSAETIVVIVVTAVATFVFSLAIFLMSLCCCTCCCVVDSETGNREDKTSRQVSSNRSNYGRTRLYVKVGSKRVPIYGPVTPLRNINTRSERQIDGGSVYGHSETAGVAVHHSHYQNEAPRLITVSESMLSHGDPRGNRNDFELQPTVTQSHQTSFDNANSGRNFIDEDRNNCIYGFDDTP
ncbi:Hyalin [Holothuria leucospilota]|uniref:Hyalin n=1 Tax=Holothuria leucospilota TaxID=206669 RepID=A0A9Q1C9T0_HOLLE|nr:Hyalin [Holothuria leucospilota]